MKVYLMIMIF